MKRKTSQTTNAHASETAITPRSCAFITTPPHRQDAERERALEELLLRRPDPAGGPFRITSRAIVTITTISSDRCAKGRMIARYTSIPPTNASASVSENESQ